MKTRKKNLIYVSKKYCEEKHVDLLSIGEEGKRHYALIKIFNKFMHNHTLHRRKNIFAVIVCKLSVQKKH